MRKVILAAVLGLVGIGSANTATAADDPPPGYRLITVTETKIVYETRTVAYQKEGTKYDCYGKPYTVCVTAYRDVEVPVRKRFTYTKLVKACDY